MKLLIVDDDVTLLENMVMYFNEDHTVKHTTYPKQAMELLSKEKFDYLITDYQMPLLNGMELAKYALGLYNIAVIMVTGDTELVSDDPRIEIRYKPVSYAAIHAMVKERKY